MKLGIVLSIALTALCPTAGRADYSIRYVGSVLSDDEQLVDASRNGWLLVKDNHDFSECVVRARLGSSTKIRLCDKGLKAVSKVNEKGLVLGTTDNGKKAAVWGDRNGLKILDTPNADYDWLAVTDMNNKGEVVGFSVTEEHNESGDITTIYQAYRWERDGTISAIRRPKSRNTQALAINDKGEIVLYSEKSDFNGALFLGKKTFKRIDRRGQSIFPSLDANYAINNRGQIASAQGALYSPRTGWRNISGVRSCDRCDYGFESDISNSGRALFSYYATYLSAYPKPAVKLSCLSPQNRVVANTRVTVQDLDYSSDTARFLNNGAVIFGTNANGDSASNQLFILEPKGSGDEIRDYCPVLTLEKSTDKHHDCSNLNEQFGRVQTCEGRFTISSAEGPLQGIAVKLYAQQSTLDGSCPLQLVDTFTSSASGNKYSFPTDPGFSYYLVISEPKFGREAFEYQNLVREGFSVDSLISPCRKPFEGLVNQG